MEAGDLDSSMRRNRPADGVETVLRPTGQFDSDGLEVWQEEDRRLTDS